MTGGIKSQSEKVVDVVVDAGRPVSAREVWEALCKDRPETPQTSVRADLESFCVNAPSRTSYAGGREPRRTNTGNRYDRLIKRDGKYLPYDSRRDGVWEIYRDPGATSTHKTAIRELARVSFSARAALDFLDSRYPATSSGTSHVVAFRNRSGRPLAFDPGRNPDDKAAIALFIDSHPPGAHDVIEYPPGKTRNHHLAAHAPELAFGRAAYSVAVSSLAELTRLCDWYDADNSHDPSQAASRESTTVTQPINKILYGPPGTGKTYHTVNEALCILDPAFLAAHETDRAALKHRFDALAQAGFIRFVTFHQSFSYEDFVEGIRAESEGGQLRYLVKPGVFRAICEDAGGSAQVASEVGVRENARIWKISIDGTGASPTSEYCLAHGEARIGWDAVGDLKNERLSDVPAYTALGANDRSTLQAFSREIEPGDVLLCIGSETEVQAVGVVQGDYEFQPTPPARVRPDYVNLLPVRWLATGLKLDIRPINGGRMFTLKTVYELTRFGWPELSDYLEGASVELKGVPADVQPKALPHVLIIDEINRGNVSRIFGELITLIEPSKRKGEKEAMEVELPYSRKKFSVPRNVHLIGTMNTADRSLAGLDVALRRRFEFVEMPPDPSALAGVVVEGIPVDELLVTMNRRIEVLLGRDYMLGHAYFMGLKNDRSLERLAEVFHRQVLPLLQEYFFEDWQKIAWVLNDHRKPEALCFLRQNAVGMAELLGNDIELPGEGRLWTIEHKAFYNPQAYLAIIKAPQVVA